MKTTLCFIFILFTFTMLALVPNSFAQETSPEYVVRQIYFHPSDRQPHQGIDTTLDTLVKDVQQLYADEMERHGFGRKTFKLETDHLGNTVRHSIRGKFSSAHYNPNNATAGVVNAAAPEIEEQFDLSEHFVYLIFYDMGSIGLTGGAGGQARRMSPFGGTADILFLNLDKALNALYFRAFTVIAHELGHAFGLNHDFRDGHYVMSYGAATLPRQLSYCTAEWLDAHRYFNTSQNAFDQVPKIALLESSFVSPPNTIRLRFEITHSARLHQAQLLTDLPAWKIANPLLYDYKSLNGNIEIVEFGTTKLAPTSEYVHLKVIDVHGNFITQGFPIDMTALVPDSEPISIPDANLAAVIREALGLAQESPITKLDILGLGRLYASNKQIKDLTGIEHATNLENLHLDFNQISDITPLTGLPNLGELLLSNNKISDVSPVLELTHLEHLWLGSNQISDVPPLTRLTQLAFLSLSYNKIADITPLKGLTNLEELYLDNCQINDEMLRLLADFQKLNVLFLNSNRIHDIAPLAQLTRLDELDLSGNKIVDITPLKGLTNLVSLHLPNNEIYDVSPLEGLVNLGRLNLVANPIKNRKPLFALLERNPDVKIYLKNSREPLPVNLSYFRAEHTKAGVILKWTTESEVDNAGFYIYRSKTKNGEFKVVNPTIIQGAGTTSERSTYTWTDTTAKPNVAYYYRIEDISHAGVRKQLATVRLKGLVSASGKLTTRWADLKTQE